MCKYLYFYKYIYLSLSININLYLYIHIPFSPTARFLPLHTTLITSPVLPWELSWDLPQSTLGPLPPRTKRYPSVLLFPLSPFKFQHKNFYRRMEMFKYEKVKKYFITLF